MADGTRWLGALALAVLVGFALVVGDSEARQPTPHPIALQTSEQISIAAGDAGPGALRAFPASTSPRVHQARRCDLRGHDGTMSTVPGLSFLVSAAGHLVPMHALTCLRRPGT